MKANASTSTTLEIENYKSKKKLSLRPLFMPEFRYLILFDKVISFHKCKDINKENQKNFDKSIFIYNYNNKKNLNDFKKTPNSTKNLFSDKYEFKNININRKYKSRNLSIKNYKSLDNENVYSHISKNKINDNQVINNKIRAHRFKLKNLYNRVNPNLNEEQFFYKTAYKKSIGSYSFKKSAYFSDVKSKLDFKNNVKMNEIKEKLKCKLFNNYNQKNSNYNSIFVKNKEKFYKYRIKNDLY